MPSPPDATAIQIAVACEIVGVSRQVRNTWIRRGLIVGRTAGTCSLEELFDFAAFAEVASCVGFDDARVVWHQVRNDCRAQWGSDRIDVIADLQLKRAVVARTDGEVASAVRHGRPTRVVDLTCRMATIQEAFERVAIATQET